MKTSPLPFVLSGVLLVAGPSTGQEAQAPPEWSREPDRAAMESLERNLEKAVSRVSLPHTAILLGPSSTSRGYRLPGYGVVYVLTPRVLPAEGQVFLMRRHRTGAGDLRVERHVAVPGDDPAWEPEQVEELERQVLVLQHAAETRRREAEEDMKRIVRNVRVHLEVARESDAEGGNVPPPQGAQAVPPDTAPVQEMSEPPWKFWFDTGAVEEDRSPDEVVEAVRSAVIEALDTRAGAVPGLDPDEWVTVAVDFVPGDVFTSPRGPTRTLIVRARQGDLTARAEGDLAAEELRRRVEVIDY